MDPEAYVGIPVPVIPKSVTVARQIYERLIAAKDHTVTKLELVDELFADDGDSRSVTQMKASLLTPMEYLRKKRVVRKT
jgi:hypothetical protein